MNDGFEIPIRRFTCTSNGNLISGELTEPAEWVNATLPFKEFPGITEPQLFKLDREKTLSKENMQNFNR